MSEKTDLLNLTADTVQAMRGLAAAAKTFRANPNDSKLDDRLRAWLTECDAVSRRWVNADTKASA